MSPADTAGLVWVPAAGGEITVIAPTGSRDVAHFRADQPDRIYAYGRSEGLVSFRWDGTDVKRQLQVRGAPPPSSANPHPENREFLPRRVFPVPKERGGQRYPTDDTLGRREPGRLARLCHLRNPVGRPAVRIPAQPRSRGGRTRRQADP